MTTTFAAGYHEQAPPASLADWVESDRRRRPAFPNGSPAFDFAGMRLWLDDVPHYSQRDVRASARYGMAGLR